MLDIKSKYDGVRLLNQLDLNTFPNMIVFKDNLQAAKPLFEKFCNSEFVMRDLESPAGKFFLIKTFEEMCLHAQEYETKFLVCESFVNYRNDMLLIGEMMLEKETNIINLTAKADKNSNHRDVFNNPEFNFHTSVYDDVFWEGSIPGFDKLFKYVTEHNLYDVIVEFCVYKKPIGTNPNQVVIVELRNNY